MHLFESAVEDGQICSICNRSRIRLKKEFKIYESSMMFSPSRYMALMIGDEDALTSRMVKFLMMKFELDAAIKTACAQSVTEVTVQSESTRLVPMRLITPYCPSISLMSTLNNLRSLTFSACSAIPWWNEIDEKLIFLKITGPCVIGEPFSNITPLC